MKNISLLDKNLIFLLSGNMSNSLTPYADIAAKLGLSEDEVLSKIKYFQNEKIIRRFGATLWHQRSGFAANAMVVFEIPLKEAETAGLALAALPHVSHCYLRQTAKGWPFNLYAMVHAESRPELLTLINEMADSLGQAKWRMLESLKELKKASRRYFADSL